MSNIEDINIKNMFNTKKGSGVLFEFKNKISSSNDKTEKLKMTMNDMKKNLIFLEKTDWMFNNKNFDVAFLERYICNIVGLTRKLRMEITVFSLKNREDYRL